MIGQCDNMLFSLACALLRDENMVTFYVIVHDDTVLKCVYSGIFMSFEIYEF